MKKHFTFGCIFFLSTSLLFSCGETKKEVVEEQRDTTTTVVTEAPTSVVDKFGTRIQKIVKSDEGILRGVNFGDYVDKVKDLENTPPLEDSTHHLGYRIDLGNYEDLDVRYHLNDQQKVWGFTLDIYLDEQSSADSLFGDFKRYFTERFGNEKFDNQRNMVAWNLADSVKVVVKDVGIKQAPGLQVQILNLKEAKAKKETAIQ